MCFSPARHKTSGRRNILHECILLFDYKSLTRPRTVRARSWAVLCGVIYLLLAYAN
jgi:hypothetical protein